MKIIYIRDEGKFVRLSHVDFLDPEPWGDREGRIWIKKLNRKNRK
jgi:hypothetical protein